MKGSAPRPVSRFPSVCRRLSGLGAVYGHRQSGARGSHQQRNTANFENRWGENGKPPVLGSLTDPENAAILRVGRVSGPVTRAGFKPVGGRAASSVGSTPASSAIQSGKTITYGRI